MNAIVRLTAVLAVATGFALGPLSFLAPGLAMAALGARARLAPPSRRYLARFAVTSASLASFFYASAGPRPGEVGLGPLSLAGEDFLTGLVAAGRLTGLFATFIIGATFLPAQDLLPYAPTKGLPGFVLGALLRLAPTLRADATRLREAQMVRGHAFDRTARAWLPLAIPLLVTSLRRGQEQALALSLAGPAAPTAAGRTTAQRWATVVVLAALAIAGRMALVAWPGVSLSFFVVFLAGVAFGPAVGLLVGGLGRLATDVALSGLHPVFLFMAPLEAVLGAGAGFLGLAVDLGQRRRPPPAYVAAVAAAAGLSMTIAFSLGADTLGWHITRWFLPGLDPGAASVAWTAFVVRGLVFNVPSALFNLVLFAVLTGPTLRALRSAGLLARHEAATNLRID